MYQQTIDLNMIPSGVPPVVHVNQYETQLNAFVFQLYNGSEPFAIPNNAAVLMNGLKPDGNVFSFAASSTSGNTAICNCEQQMVPLAGTVVCELRVRTASEIIGTCNFILLVEEAPLHDDSVISETTIPLIEQAIDIAANLAEYIETTLDARDEAVASAEAAAASEANAAVYNSNVEQTYNSIETAKQNANTAAQTANAEAAKLGNITATANTLAEGASATASYNSTTGVITFGIPRGATGASGITSDIMGLFAMYVEDGGDLYVYSDDSSDIGDNFEYNSDTGALEYVFTYSDGTEETGTGGETGGETSGEESGTEGGE
jgi:hypothetical protein